MYIRGLQIFHTRISKDYMIQRIQEWTKKNFWNTPFNRPYHFNFFKGCIPQILLGPFWNTLSQILLRFKESQKNYRG